MASSHGRPPAPVHIRDVRPQVDCGRVLAKRCLGDRVSVSAEVVTHGASVVRVELRSRAVGTRRWGRVAMAPVPDEPDRYAAEFTAASLGTWEFTVDAWIDRVATWQEQLRRRLAAGQTDLATELAEGGRLLGDTPPDVETALAARSDDRHGLASLPHPLRVEVDPVIARVGAWYELFPRSFGGLTGVRAQLPPGAEPGLDVVYLTPIHPIGTTHRKGRDNSLVAAADDPGSPWAIGGPAGGHTAVHPDLGSIDDFAALVSDARALGLEIALDLAIQCSPDHPWLAQHPEWFRWRVDGTVQFAENPPKRYEDIVNVDFECDDWRPLWNALRDVVQFWIDQGVRVFRVDNPHTKPLAFWEWLIRKVRKDHPDVVFLSEAFTRPPLMYALAAAGFQQSYTYFTWRTTAAELREYVEEMAGDVHEYFRPNFFTNTPDILHEYLQHGGPGAFSARLVLAATLSPAYGIYSGFEHFEHEAVRPGSEEYLHSEKYEVRERRLDGPLLPLVQRLNEIRRSSCAFSVLDDIVFLDAANDSILAYAKQRGDETFVVCVNLDPHAHAAGLVQVPDSLALGANFPVTDLLDGATYHWTTGGNYVLLGGGGAHVLRVR
jgi:starch synthase (maltosyl-transferring)